MKKYACLLLAILFLLCLAGCGAESSALLETGAGKTTIPVATERKIDKTGNADLSDCHIELLSLEAQYSDLNDDMIGVLMVKFTNNSTETKSLFFTARIKAYQNGVELDGAAWIPADHGVDSTSSTDVLPGYSVTVGDAFMLKNETDPVTIHITTRFGDVLSEMTFNP